MNFNKSGLEQFQMEYVRIFSKFVVGSNKSVKKKNQWDQWNCVSEIWKNYVADQQRTFCGRLQTYFAIANIFSEFQS